MAAEKMRRRGIEDVAAGQHPEHEDVVIVRLGSTAEPVNRDAARDLRDQLSDTLDQQGDGLEASQ